MDPSPDHHCAMLDVILIPGINSPPIATWAIQTQTWRQAFAKVGIDLNFIEIQPVHITSKETLEDWFSDYAEKVISQLDKTSMLKNSKEMGSRVLLIAHSTGGLVAKQILCRLAWAMSQAPELAGAASRMIGAIFLAVLHKPENDKAMVQLLLQQAQHGHSKLNKQTASILKKAHDLDKMAELFENSLNNPRLDAKVLSILPAFDRTMSKTTWIKRQTEQAPNTSEFIVGIRETVVESSCSFEDICQLKLVPDQMMQVIHWAKDAVNSKTKQEETNITRAMISQLSPRSASSSDQAQQGSSVGGNFVHVPTSNIMTSQVPKLRLPCFMMDESLQKDHVLGRHEIFHVLDQILLPGSSTSQIGSQSHSATSRFVTILGLGGYGKTALAAAYASSRRSRFDAVFWINAGNIEKIQEGYSNAARQLHLVAQDEGFDPVSAREDAKGWLAKPIKVLSQSQDIIAPNEAQWLLILDNADEPDILEGFLPPLGVGSILITSRRARHIYEQDLRRLQISPSETHIEELGPLSVEEGAELIRHWTNLHSERYFDRSIEISKILGAIPLALLQCARLLHESDITFEDFIKRIQIGHERHDLIDRFEHVNLYDNHLTLPVRGSLGISWAMSRLSLEAKAVADVLSFLDPDQIDQGILEELSHIGSEHGLQGFPKSLGTFWDAKQQLRSGAFIKVGDSEIRIHREVQDIFQLFMGNDRRNQALRCVLALLTRHYEKDLWSGRSHGIERWVKCNPLFHHLTRLVELYENCSTGDSWEPNLLLARLLYRSSWLQFEQMNIRPVLLFLDLATKICESVHCDESQRILRDIQHTLGAIGTWTNDANMALKNTTKVLESWKREAEQTGIYDRNIAAGYCQYATALMMSNNLIEAEDCLRTALSILSKLENKELASSHKLILGYNLWLQGRLGDAESILKDGLAIREVAFGENDTYSYKSGAYHAALGNVELARRKFPEAQRLHELAMSQYEKTHGKHHPGTADIYHIVARHKIREGKFDEALILLNRALDIWKTDADMHRPERARSMFVKADVLRRTGDEGAKVRDLATHATSLFGELTGQSNVDEMTLTEEDFNRLVMFWA
ncbi:hypothetical protein F4803DRAFT_510742, partial [Xylaria telfairii]